MSGDRICLNRYEFTYMSIQSRETVLKVPYLCCFSIMDIQVPPVPNQPKTFRFPQRTFGVKKPEQRSFQPSWFDSRPWLHYDEAKDLAFCHLCINKEACAALLLTNPTSLMDFLIGRTLVYL